MVGDGRKIQRHRTAWRHGPRPSPWIDTSLHAPCGAGIYRDKRLQATGGLGIANQHRNQRTTASPVAFPFAGHHTTPHDHFSPSLASAPSHTAVHVEDKNEARYAKRVGVEQDCPVPVGGANHVAYLCTARDMDRLDSVAKNFGGRRAIYVWAVGVAVLGVQMARGHRTVVPFLGIAA